MPLGAERTILEKSRRPQGCRLFTCAQRLLMRKNAPAIQKRRSGKLLVTKLQSGQQDLNARPEMVPLLRLAAGPDRRELAAAHHSENTPGFSALSDCPVKGMAFRESRAVPE